MCFPAATAMQCNTALLLRRQLGPTKYREGSTPQHFRVKKRQGAFKTKYVLFFYMPISVSDILGGMYAYCLYISDSDELEGMYACI